MSRSEPHAVACAVGQIINHPGALGELSPANWEGFSQFSRSVHEWCIHRPPARSTPARLSPACRQRWSAGRGRRSPAGVRAGVSINGRKKSERVVEDRPPFSPWFPCSWAWSNRFRTFKDGITVSNVYKVPNEGYRFQLPNRGFAVLLLRIELYFCIGDASHEGFPGWGTRLFWSLFISHYSRYK